MATKNDVTGDTIQTKVSTKEYRENFDKIFGEKQLITEVVGDKAEPSSPQVLSESYER